MMKIEDFENPEDLVKAAVAIIRENNGLKTYRLPTEATREQQEILAKELRQKNPWRQVLIVRHVKAGDVEDVPETHSLEELRSMVIDGLVEPVNNEATTP